MEYNYHNKALAYRQSEYVGFGSGMTIHSKAIEEIVIMDYVHHY